MSESATHRMTEVFFFESSNQWSAVRVLKLFSSLKMCVNIPNLLIHIHYTAPIPWKLQWRFLETPGISYNVLSPESLQSPRVDCVLLFECTEFG